MNCLDVKTDVDSRFKRADPRFRFSMFAIDWFFHSVFPSLEMVVSKKKCEVTRGNGGSLMW